MTSDLPPWLGEEPDEEPPPARHSRRAWLVVLALLPWLVVLGLVVTGVLPPGRSGAPGPGDEPAGAHQPEHRDVQDASPSSARATTEGDEGPTGTGDPVARDADEPGSPAPGGSGADRHTPQAAETTPGRAWGRTPQAGRVAAVALTVTRAWLTDVGPRIGLEGIEPVADRYLEHATVERIEPHGDHAVATVLALVLERGEDAYDDATARRLAVPVAVGPPPRPAGQPWWLDEVAWEATAPEGLEPERDEDTLLAISEALRAATGPDARLARAQQTPDGWWLAHVTDAGDGPAPEPEEADEATTGPIWLRPGADGPVVAGAPPSAAHAQEQEQ